MNKQEAIAAPRGFARLISRVSLMYVTLVLSVSRSVVFNGVPGPTACSYLLIN